ncbi:hypothetical protein SAMN07250955_101361 [Arboricoccus pini]|uniref:CoA-binding domain-containing protein n=1 Tax=Arboricoccus pini TaxID=1963835 RepID=A0A212Q2K2_9PROT|nr:CoA-binding protein [Arboricoccus pini]SNB53439.1 hypothetical protein SAMN07250955_101361 [Arboricoccus pini]
MEDVDLSAILRETRSIAVLGASTNPARPSHSVTGYLVSAGFAVYPVNPACAGQHLFDRLVLPDLAGLGFVPDLVDIFRRSEEAGALIDAAVAMGVRCVWLQLGVHADAASSRARSAGTIVVQDRCLKVEHARLMGHSA